MRIATLRFIDAVKMFYNGCTELHEENVNWENFKSAFRRRFGDRAVTENYGENTI